MTGTTNMPLLTRAQVIEHVLLQNLNQKLTTALAFGVAKEIDDLITKLATLNESTQAAISAAPEATASEG